MAGPSVRLPRDTTLCPGATLLLNANAGDASRIWQDGSTGPQLLVSTAGTYWVRLTDEHTCVASDTIHVAYRDLGGFDLGPDTALCSGQALTLHAQLPGGTTRWSTGASGPSLLVAAAGTYTATIRIGACSVSDTITIRMITTPTVDLGADHALCEGDQWPLSAPPTTGASYLWEDGSSTRQRTVQSAGIYWVHVTVDGCAASDTIHIEGVPRPSFSLGADTALCPGDTRSIDLTATGATYLWNDGSAAATRTLGPGNWSASVTVGGCTGTDTIVITEAPLPTLSLPADTVLCPGLTWTINVAQAGATYHWQDGSRNGSFIVDQAGSYAVTADLHGCTADAETHVTYLDPAQLDLGPDTALCPGGTLTLSSPFVGVNITWQDGSHDSQYQVQYPGVYRLLADANGCTAEDSIQVTVVPLVTPDLGTDQHLCDGQTLTLEVAPGNAAVHWSTGATTNSITVGTAGTYGVTLLLGGCSARDSIDVTFDPMITHVDLGDDAEICPGHPLELDASAVEGDYRWSTGETTPTITAALPGIYTVLVEGTCLQATDTVVVTMGDCLPFIFVPSAFTPNGDGTNDVFTPAVDGELMSYDLMILDRWGLPVFHSTQPGQPWDGTLNGARLPDDVYVWRLRYKALGSHGLQEERLLGSVTLLR
ncbi:MAG: gliding motility-associated C-terminal domain-containing protein [Flavobacteriales bacterium]